MKKLVLISLDLVVALPIVATSFALLFSSIGGSQGYLLGLASFQNRYLYAVTVSHTAASSLDSGTMNYSVAIQLVQNISKESGLGLSVTNYSSPGPCYESKVLCRLVTLTDSAYLLVVNYANTS